MRLIEASFQDKCTERVREVVEKAEPTYYRFFAPDDEGRRLLKVFFGKQDIQQFVDDIQRICELEKDFRLLVLPVEATAPPLEEEEKTDRERQRKVALREEIYEDVVDGAALSADFFILTLASTVVAAIGLNADNVAAVIGAMVIAPLLGPILAFSLGAALGDFTLILRAARNAIAGLATGIAASAVISLLMALNRDSHELMSRTVVGLDSIALALAAGAAAALSIATGVSSALVGVMVAVALLPPAAAIGLFLGAGAYEDAGRALLLLVVNVVCIMISSQIVYAYKGVRPRTWIEQRSADRAVKVNAVVLALLLAALTGVVLLAR